MAILSKILGLFRTSPPVPGPDESSFVYVKIPEDIQPIARGEKYEDPLEERLLTLGLGSITGGGSQLGENRPDGTPTVAFCGIDIDIKALPEGLLCLQATLVELGAPIGTEIHYSFGERKLQDELHESGWVEGQSRTFLHPGFGV